MEQPILDFVIMMGDDMDSELDTYHLFRIINDPKPKNGRVLLQLQAVDVGVRKSGGFYWLKAMTGQPLIANGLDLGKRREVSVAQDLMFVIKQGKPMVFGVYPDDYEKLPKELKDNQTWALLFKMFYLARKSLKVKEEIMEELGYQKSEIDDTLAQSQTTLNNFMLKQVQDWTTATEQQLKNAPPKPQPKDGVGEREW
jgi:hypothetical protein